MMKKIFLVFGLLVFGITLYSDVDQIELIHQSHVNHDIENTVQTNQSDPKETDIVSQAPRKR